VARGRSERSFGTHQQRLVSELAAAGSTEMSAANGYLERCYRPAHNDEFAQPALKPDSAFVPWAGTHFDDILCEQFERKVGVDNCVSFGRPTLQIPRQRHRCQFVKLAELVHRYPDDSLAIFHGPRRLSRHTADGQLQEDLKRAAQRPPAASCDRPVGVLGLRPRPSTPPKHSANNLCATKLGSSFTS
jgi:hypothetical protein